MGSELGWEESPLRVLSLQGPAGYKGMVGTIGAAGRPVSAPSLRPGVRVAGWHRASPLSPIIPPVGQGRPQRTSRGAGREGRAGR